jgi:hypothetical protein
MSLKTASVLKDGTVATTGGTATTFIDKGTSPQCNSWVGILDDGSEFLAQSSATFTVKDPKVQSSAPNGYTQARSSVVLKVPLALDNGEYTLNTIKIELAVDHETTAAEIATMKVYAAQFLQDSDFTEFWTKQALG